MKKLSPFKSINRTTDMEASLRSEAVNFSELSPLFLFCLKLSVSPFGFGKTRIKETKPFILAKVRQSSAGKLGPCLTPPTLIRRFKVIPLTANCDLNLNLSLPEEISNANECQQQSEWSTHPGISRSRFMTPTWPSWPVTLHVHHVLHVLLCSTFPRFPPISPWNVCIGESFVRSSPAESSWIVLLLCGSAFWTCNEPQRVLNFE